MKENKSRVTKEMILETTLRLIDENQGIKNVTLRDIAKNTGCAHTNLYNYFSSLDDIFWEALGQVLLIMMEDCSKGLSTENDEEQNFYVLLSSIIDFFMNHPGWYRLIWLDSIGGTPSPEVVNILHSPGETLAEEIVNINRGEISKEKAFSIANILTCYLHGEICIWLNNRSLEGTKEETKYRIILNLKQLYKLLIK